MAGTHELDNAVWSALTGPQASFALGRGQARRFDPRYARFAAIENHTAKAWRDLADIVPPGDMVFLFRQNQDPTPPGWEALPTRQLVQMVSEIDVPPSDLPRGPPVRLGDADDMHDLVARTEPGPFAPRTPDLGTYIGYRGENGLLAMGGERLRLAHHVEISAVAVDPAARGLGLGAAIVLHLAARIRAEGKTPFLHVFPENPAITLYQRLGFRERTRFWVLPRRRRQIGPE